MCFAQHANTSTNKPLRKQAEPWDFAHKDFFKKERKEKDGSNGRTSFVAERTFPTRCGKRGPSPGKGLTAVSCQGKASCV